VPGLEAFGESVQEAVRGIPARTPGTRAWTTGNSHSSWARQAGAWKNTNAHPGGPRRGQLPGKQAWLLVFDDISEIVSAQRAQAWGEVARRLAHEIKNPLTPIQLSAERLEMKLTGKVASPSRPC
jgi:signal transduction histidine kinase